jgi:Protein of unknown function (DUF3617).
MKIQFARTTIVPLLVFLSAFAAVCAVVAQTVETPPIKMGFWQTETSTSMAGAENLPEGQAGKHTSVVQGCLTPETWKSEFQKIQNEQSGNCTATNAHQDSHSFSFDEICKSDAYNTTAHLEAVFDNREHMHGTIKVNIAGPAFPQGITMNMTLTSHYLGADCGDVKPGEGKVISQE